MQDLTEDALAPDVVVRRASDTEVDIRHGEDGDPPLVGLTHGVLWARAEPSSAGVDLGHGALNVVVRAGTVLLDAQGGAGLVIVLRGEVHISSRGELVRVARAGDALGFDDSGEVGEPDPVDAAELARDPFVSLNLVLDSLGGVPITVAAPSPELVGAGAPDAPEPTAEAPDRKPRRFGGRKK